MKRWIHSSTEIEDIFAMSKILDKYAIPDIANNIGKYVYFSECNSSHGPRIKFYGGSKETSSTKNAPTLAYDTDGSCTVELADWMNKKNCPNGFDTAYLKRLESFITHAKPILLLVWFGHLDEGDALAYFHGQITFEDLLADLDKEVPETVNSLDQLDAYCKENSWYAF